MRNRSLMFSSIGVCIALASCSDAVGPRASALPSEGGAPSVQFDAVRRQVNILVESPTAPPLEAYTLEFWAIQGAGKTVVVNYRPGSNAVSNRFMRLVIPSGTQLYRPDGSRVADGDSVLITATIDRQLLLVTFGPGGLAFGGSRPARLRLYWGNANLDLNGDGLVNQLDEDIIRTLLVIAYQPAAGDPWSIPSDQEKSPDNRYIEISLPHFSNYAISW